MLTQGISGSELFEIMVIYYIICSHVNKVETGDLDLPSAWNNVLSSCQEPHTNTFSGKVQG